jgi:hypothetical protein
MDDILTLIVIIIGILSLFTGKKRTTTPPQKRPQPTRQESEYVWETAEEAESDWEYATPQERPTRQENKELSPMDVIGKILTGDLDDLLQSQKPTPTRVESEYIDPVKSHPNKPLQSHFQSETIQQTPGTSPSEDSESSRLYPELSNPVALRQAIVVREILDRPLSKRNRRRSVA